MKLSKPTSRDELISLAEQDTNEAWELVGAHLADKRNVTPELVEWAKNKAKSQHSNGVRDLGATVFSDTDVHLTQAEQDSIEDWMRFDAYHIVRYRLAI